MTLLITGLAIFFGLHFYSSVRPRAAGKDRSVIMGKNLFRGLYSIAALAGLILIIIGFGASRPAAILYTPPAWGGVLNVFLMAAALIILIASQLPAGFIKTKLKHPLLISLKIWALGHLLSNGELNSVLLFGSFLGFAVFNRISLKKRGDIGAAHAAPKAQWDMIAIVAGLALFIAFMFGLHGTLIGVEIIPGMTIND